MKKILFIINGLGMGNSTRCDSIIQKIQSRKLEVDIITSGNGIEYFKKRNYINEKYNFKSFNYAKAKDGKISVLSSFLTIPFYFILLLKNVLLLNKILKENAYNAIVIDSDYSLLFLKWKITIPVFALNNASVIVDECSARNYIPQSIKSQLIIEKLDNFFHKKIPDYVICPSMKKNKNTPKNINFSPFVREKLEQNRKAKNVTKKIKNCLIMLSGSSFGSSTEFIEKLNISRNIKINVVGREGVSNKNIKYYGKMMQNEELPLTADIMIINAGFSAVSEAFFLGVPTIVLPVENHAEQYINAKIFEEKGLGYVSDVTNINLKLSLLIENYQKIKLNHENNKLRVNGANAAGLFIKENI